MRAVEGLEQDVSSLQKKVEEKDTLLNAQAARIAEQAAHIAEKDARIAEQDARIAEQDAEKRSTLVSEGANVCGAAVICGARYLPCVNCVDTCSTSFTV